MQEMVVNLKNHSKGHFKGKFMCRKQYFAIFALDCFCGTVANWSFLRLKWSFKVAIILAIICYMPNLNRNVTFWNWKSSNINKVPFTIGGMNKITSELIEFDVELEFHPLNDIQYVIYCFLHKPATFASYNCAWESSAWSG